MTTALQIRNVWQSKVWNNKTVRAISDKIHFGEATEDSESETANLYFDKRVNYFECIVSRGQSYEQIGGGTSQVFAVEIRYTLEKDTAGEAHSMVQDSFATVYDIMYTALSDSWASTVDYWTPQEKPVEINSVDVDNRPCWRGSLTFTGYKLN